MPDNSSLGDDTKSKEGAQSIMAMVKIYDALLWIMVKYHELL